MATWAVSLAKSAPEAVLTSLRLSVTETAAKKTYRSVALIVLCILETIYIPVQTSYITNRGWLNSLACHVCGFAVGLNLFMIWRNVSRWSGPSLCPREEDREAVGGGGKAGVSSSRGAV